MVRSSPKKEAREGGKTHRAEALPGRKTRAGEPTDVDTNYSIFRSDDRLFPGNSGIVLLNPARDGRQNVAQPLFLKCVTSWQISHGGWRGLGVFALPVSRSHGRLAGPGGSVETASLLCLRHPGRTQTSNRVCMDL